jgi:serine/threonine-protein kinase
MDFGIAKVIEGMQGTNTQSIGTLQYMSPEQIDARTIDARSDLYSLGLMFYEMIEGAPPFTSASPRELLNLQCTAAAPALSEEVRRGLPRGVEDLLFSMLEKKADDRPASAREVVEKLSMFRSATDAPARPTRARPGRSTDRVSAAPATPRMPDAPSPPRTDTMTSGESPAAKKKENEPTPKTDTVALVEANASKPREVPTWLAIVAIVALSLVAGMTTYLVRLRATANDPPSTTTTASAAVKGP